MSFFILFLFFHKKASYVRLYMLFTWIQYTVYLCHSKYATLYSKLRGPLFCISALVLAIYQFAWSCTNFFLPMKAAFVFLTLVPDFAVAIDLSFNTNSILIGYLTPHQVYPRGVLIYRRVALRLSTVPSTSIHRYKLWSIRTVINNTFDRQQLPLTLIDIFSQTLLQSA